MMLEEVELQLDTVREVLMEVQKQTKAALQPEDQILEHQLEQTGLAIVMVLKDQLDLVTVMERNEETLIQLGTEQILKQIEILIQIREEVLRQAIISPKQIQGLLITNHQIQEVLIIRNQAQDLLTLK